MNRRPIAIMRPSCSDSSVVASQMDGVFGSDTGGLSGMLPGHKPDGITAGAMRGGAVLERRLDSVLGLRLELER